MDKQRGSVEVIRQLVEMSNRISIDEMAAAEKMAAAAGGRLVSVSAMEDDDWCGTGRFKIPIPLPNPDGLITFLNYCIKNWINWEILINGTPVPDEIILEVNRAARRR